MRHHEALLQDIYGNRRWLLASDVLAGAGGLVDALTSVGVDDVLVLAGSRGTGAVPDVPTVLLHTTGTSLMAAIRAFNRALGDVGPVARDRVDEFDPSGVARVITPIFSGVRSVAGRPVFGPRRPAWQALEDKTTVDAVWQAAGVPQAPAVIVDAEVDALRRAADALDEGQGTVWVADNRLGWHGGAAGLRWVRTDGQAVEAATDLAELAHRVRVMPFLEGVPCSIHGMVFDEATIAFRPCEMVALRRPGRTTLLYAGTSTWWDPPAPDRDDLRTLARRVGDHLRATVGYRGAFTVDGVMTAEGFRPTELNPRYGAAMGLLAAAADLPLYLVHLGVVEGVDADWRPFDLEQWVVEQADAARRAHGTVLVEAPQPERELRLRWDGDVLREVSDGHADVTLLTGPAPTGGAVRIVPEAHAGTPGEPVAPLVAAALAEADARWDLGIGPVEAARDVRGDG